MAFRAARAALAFVIVEALFRASSALLGLVGHDDSVARALLMALHLVNSFLLTASLAIVAWNGAHSSARLLRQHGAPWFALTAGALLVVSASGSTTALGNTVRPTSVPASLAARLESDYPAGVHYLDRARPLHPALAVSASFVILAISPRLTEGITEGKAPRLLRAFWALVLVQVAAGVVDHWLVGPGWMQVVHLALGLVIWVLCILAWAAAPRVHRRDLAHALANRPPNTAP